MHLPSVFWRSFCFGCFGGRRRRRWSLIPIATALLGGGLVAVERFGSHWLLARHRGRAALVSTHGDARSCRMA